MLFEFHLTVGNAVGLEKSEKELLQILFPAPEVLRTFEEACDKVGVKPLQFFLGVAPTAPPIQLQTCSEQECANREDAIEAVEVLARRFEQESGIRVLRMRVELQCERSAHLVQDADCRDPGGKDLMCYHEMHLKIRADYEFMDDLERMTKEWKMLNKSILWKMSYSIRAGSDALMLTVQTVNGLDVSVGTNTFTENMKTLIQSLRDGGLMVEPTEVEYAVLDNFRNLDQVAFAAFQSHSPVLSPMMKRRNRPPRLGGLMSVESLHTDNDVRLGVRFDVIEEILQFPDYQAGMTTGEVCMKLIRPLTIHAKCSYAIFLLTGDGLRNRQHSPVGKANVFMSHAWQYPFQWFVEGAKAIHEEDQRNEREAIFWFDILTVNQHSDYYKRDWFDTFQASVKKIGRTALILSPWNDPIPLRRCWCLWEIFCTLKADIQLDIVIPSSEMNSFHQGMIESMEGLLRAIGTIDVQQSEASLVSDKLKILGAISKDNVVNMDEMNKIIMNEIREWLADAALEHLSLTLSRQQMNEGILHHSHQVIQLLLEFAKYEDAIPLLKETLEACETHLTDQHPLTQKCSILLCWQLIDNARYNEAEAYLGQALPNHRESLGEAHPITLKASCWYLRLLHETGRFGEAEMFGLGLLDICEAGGDNLQETKLELKFLVGKLYFDMEKLDLANDLLHEAILGCETQLPKHWVKLSASMFRGRVLTELGHFQEAEDLLVPALAHAVTARGEKHKVSLYAKAFLARLYQRTNQVDKALALAPVVVCKQSLGSTHWLTKYCTDIVASCSRARFNDSIRSLRQRFQYDRLREALGQFLAPEVILDEQDFLNRLRIVVRTVAEPNLICPLLETILNNGNLVDAFARKSHTHSNGFDKLILMLSSGFSMRLHVWKNSENLSQEPEVHNHRWDFASAILRGEYEHEMWNDQGEDERNGEYHAYIRTHNTDHLDEGFALQPVKRKLFKFYSGSMKRGETYALHHKQLHRTLTNNEETITLIIHGTNVSTETKMFSRNLISLERQFVSKFPATRYVQSIHDCLKNLRLVFQKRKRVLILLSGKKAAGKDFFGHKLTQALRNQQITAVCKAQAIMSKKIYADMNLGVDLTRLLKDREYKEIHRAGVTKIYQENIEKDPDFFQRKFLEMLLEDSSDVIVVTDFRRKNELSYFSQQFPGETITVRIEASLETRIAHGLAKEDATSFEKVGVSKTSNLLETELDDFENWQFLFNNDNADEGHMDEFINNRCLPVITNLLGKMVSSSRYPAKT